MKLTDLKPIKEHTKQDRREYRSDIMAHSPESLSKWDDMPEVSEWPPSQQELFEIERALFQRPDVLAYWARFDWTSFSHITASQYHYDSHQDTFMFYDVPTITYFHDQLEPDRSWLRIKSDGTVVKRDGEYAHLSCNLPSVLRLCREEVERVASKMKWKRGIFYIRFGDWPENERSRNWLIKDREVYEEGVSAYHADYNLQEDRWEIEATVHYAAITGTMQELIYSNRPVYLVQGDEIRQEGADGEPLLRNVRKIKRLDKMDVSLPGVFDPRDDL